MLERPDSIEKYLLVAKEINRLTKEKDALRQEVLAILHVGSYEDIYIQTDESEELDEDLLFEWIKDTFPKALIDEVTESKLNWDMVKSLIDLQVLDLTKIPATCYVRTTTHKIMTARRKKNDN